MGGYRDGGAPVRGFAGEEAVDVVAARGIEPGVGFVHQNDVSLARERLCEEGALTLPPGQLDEPAGVETGHADSLEHLGDDLAGPSSAEAATPRPHGDRLANGEREGVRHCGTLNHE